MKKLVLLFILSAIALSLPLAMSVKAEQDNPEPNSVPCLICPALTPSTATVTLTYTATTTLTATASRTPAKGTPTPTRIRTATAKPSSTPTASATPSPTGTPTTMLSPTFTATPVVPTPNAEAAQFENGSIQEINRRRSALGLPPFTANSALSLASRRQAWDMVSHQLCQHVGTDGSQFWDRTDWAGYALPAWAWAEVGACSQSSMLGTIDAWQSSPDHWAILTAPDMNEIGCGAAPYQGHGTWWEYCVVGVRPTTP